MTAHDVPPAPPPRDRRADSWTVGKVMTAVLGTLLILASYPAFITGAGTLIVDRMARDDGYLTSSTRTIGTSGRALVSQDIDLSDMHATGAGMMRHFVGDIRFRLSSPDGAPVFAGIAPTQDVTAYLDGAPYVIVDADGSVVRRVPGDGRVIAPPTMQRIWTTSVHGRGEQMLKWTVEPGRWSLVMMSPSGRPGVEVRVDVGAEAPGLGTIAWASLVLGAVLLLTGSTLVIVAVRRSKVFGAAEAPPPPQASE